MKSIGKRAIMVTDTQTLQFATEEFQQLPKFDCVIDCIDDRTQNLRTLTSYFSLIVVLQSIQDVTLKSQTHILQCSCYFQIYFAYRTLSLGLDEYTKQNELSLLRQYFLKSFLAAPSGRLGINELYEIYYVAPECLSEYVVFRNITEAMGVLDRFDKNTEIFSEVGEVKYLLTWFNRIYHILQSIQTQDLQLAKAHLQVACIFQIWYVFNIVSVENNTVLLGYYRELFFAELKKIPDAEKTAEELFWAAHVEISSLPLQISLSDCSVVSSCLISLALIPASHKNVHFWFMVMDNLYDRIDSNLCNSSFSYYLIQFYLICCFDPNRTEFLAGASHEAGLKIIGGSLQDISKSLIATLDHFAQFEDFASMKNSLLSLITIFGNVDISRHNSINQEIKFSDNWLAETLPLIKVNLVNPLIRALDLRMALCCMDRNYKRSVGCNRLPVSLFYFNAARSLGLTKFRQIATPTIMRPGC